MLDESIVGIGETRPTRVAQKDIRGLVLEAIDEALDDAGLSADDVDGLVSDGVYGPRAISFADVGAHLGKADIWSGPGSIGGAGIMSAPARAAAAIASGRANVVVGYFGMDNGSRKGGPYGNHGRYGAKSYFEKPYGFTGQPLYFAKWARR